MKFLGKLLSGGLGGIVEQVGKVVDDATLSAEEKAKMKMQLKSMLLQHEEKQLEAIQTEMESRERVITAELKQDDKYTKRARPTVVYVGLGFIFFNYCLVPLLRLIPGVEGVGAFDLPNGFWAGWSGIVGTWAIGRTVEKRGISNRVTQFITGSKSRPGVSGDNEPVG